MRTGAHLFDTSMRKIEERKARKHARKIQKQIRKAHGQQAWYKRQHILHILRHLLPLWMITCMLTAIQTECKAQILEQLFTESPRIDSIPVGSLRAEVDASAFFHDNEYTSRIQKGYTLPGARIIPHLAYNPLRQVNLELGASMLFYQGANKYPCYAYHDIATWKGNQYQSGTHILPWVRLQASLRHIDIILGNIYGGSSHRLSTPIFNPEQNLSADPETGIQILVHRRHFESDTWLNWQSYIFEEDSHQEAFTVGESARLQWGSNTSSRWRLNNPIQLTIQHRGGEQDTTSLGVQTLCNASLGIALEGKPFRQHIDRLSAQLAGLISYQQAGRHWDFDTGFALHAGAEMELLHDLKLQADYIHAPRHFASLFGNPFFSTFSLKNPGLDYHGINTLQIGIGYKHTFAQNYTLGAQGTFYNLHAPSSGSKPALSESDFSFGLYFHISPSILIKRFGS